MQSALNCCLFLDGAECCGYAKNELLTILSVYDVIYTYDEVHRIWRFTQSPRPYEPVTGSINCLLRNSERFENRM